MDSVAAGRAPCGDLSCGSRTLRPIPVFLADLHGDARIVEGQVQMVEPDIASLLVYRERVCRLRMQGLPWRAVK